MHKPIPTRNDPWVRWSRILLVLIVAATLAALAGCSGARDDSDMPDGRVSGVSVRTDHLTGCQYLVSPGDGITPRMDRDGKQVCK